jgi:hypothetical protein
LRRAAAVPVDSSALVLSRAVVLVGTGGGSVSVSVSLPPPPTPVVGSGETCLLLFFFEEDLSSLDVVFLGDRASAAFAASTSRANQLIAYHRPAHRTERMAKWIECVKRRREKRTS